MFYTDTSVHTHNLTSECGHKKLKPGTVQLCCLYRKKKSSLITKERESYQISLNFKILVFIFLTFSPPVLENVTLRYLPLGGALILVFWLWLHPVCVQSLIHCCKLSRSPMPFSSAPSTQTPSNTNLLDNAHSMHSNKYSVLGLNSRVSLKESN